MKKFKEFILALVLSIVICFLVDQVFDISKDIEVPKKEEIVKIEGWFLDDGKVSPVNLSIKIKK